MCPEREQGATSGERKRERERERDGCIEHQGRNPDLHESEDSDELLCVCSWWAAIKAFATQDEVKKAVMSDPRHVHLLVFVAPGWCHWSQKQLQELQANFGVCRFACLVALHSMLTVRALYYVGSLALCMYTILALSETLSVTVCKVSDYMYTFCAPWACQCLFA